MKRIKLFKLLHFLKRKKEDNRFKILYLIVLTIFIFFLIYFYSLEPDIKARDFLPPETSFYYEWTEKDENIKINIFDNSIPDNNKDKILNIIAQKINKVEDIIWFKIKEDNNFLIKFSHKIKKDYLKELIVNNPHYFFKIKQDYILFITEEKELLNILPNYLVEDFIINNQKKGINIYWKNNEPDFLKELVIWLNPLLKNKEEGVFINLDKDSINLFLKREKKGEDLNLASAKIINDFDLLTLFGNSLENKNILNNFLTSLYTSFPHHSLALGNFLEDIILLQKNDNYLLISSQDWQSRIGLLIQSREVIEVDNILPDGTKYIELKQAAEQTIIKDRYLETEYWQIDNLWGLNLEQFYYLSNSKDIIKEVIRSNNNLNDIVYTCLEESNNNINNLLYLKTAEIDNKAIKEYLE